MQNFLEYDGIVLNKFKVILEDDVDICDIVWVCRDEFDLFWWLSTKSYGEIYAG